MYMFAFVCVCVCGEQGKASKMIQMKSLANESCE